MYMYHTFCVLLMSIRQLHVLLQSCAKLLTLIKYSVVGRPLIYVELCAWLYHDVYSKLLSWCTCSALLLWRWAMFSWSRLLAKRDIACTKMWVHFVKRICFSRYLHTFSWSHGFSGSETCKKKNNNESEQCLFAVRTFDSTKTCMVNIQLNKIL